MKKVKFKINFGGYVGTDEEFSIEVEDDATREEIEDEVDKEYEDIIRDNCSLEITDYGD